MHTNPENLIYFDSAATTPIRDEVKDAINQHLGEFGNPSSKYQKGLLAKEHIERVRESFKEYVGARDRDNLIFTGSGSESNNLAIKGFLFSQEHKSPHIITSTIEHPSVLKTFKYLETVGYDVSYITVDNDGIIKIEELKQAIRKNTLLISIMYANNETGSIQPIKEIGKIARDNNIIFHTDAIQAFGKVPIDIYDLNIDMFSFSGHKIYAPKGIGGLVYRSDIKLTPIIHGGGQEYGIRAGTENTLGIIAIGKALELVKMNFNTDQSNFVELKRLLIKKIKESVSDIQINGDPLKTLPNIVNISFKGIESETILFGLDAEGICVSKGSACSSNSIIPSHVLVEMGIPTKDALGAVRFSFGSYNKLSDIDYLIEKLPGIIERARKISSVFL